MGGGEGPGGGRSCTAAWDDAVILPALSAAVAAAALATHERNTMVLIIVGWVG